MAVEEQLAAILDVLLDWVEAALTAFPHRAAAVAAASMGQGQKSLGVLSLHSLSLKNKL